jgi:Asp-tRNA(Asn)/Glu-tRNA(Gln) amidotransferase A subunit family amidase
MCGRSSDGLNSWHTLVDYSLVGDTEWEEGRRVEVCSRRCARLAYMTDERVPDAVRPHYEDAVRVLEAAGARASDVDPKTARRALQFTTQVLRNLFEIPAERAARSEPESEDEPE